VRYPDLGTCQAIVREPDSLHHGARHGAIRSLEQFSAVLSGIYRHLRNSNIKKAIISHPHGQQRRKSGMPKAIRS
jgi:hypothetical protein